MTKPYEETWYVAHGSIMVQVGASPSGEDFVMQYGGKGGRAARIQLGAAAPDMARAGMLLYARVAEAAQALPSARTAEALAEMDTSVTIPSSIIREVFAAMRKGGVLP